MVSKLLQSMVEGTTFTLLAESVASLKLQQDQALASLKTQQDQSFAILKFLQEQTQCQTDLQGKKLDDLILKIGKPMDAVLNFQGRNSCRGGDFLWLPNGPSWGSKSGCSRHTSAQH